MTPVQAKNHGLNFKVSHGRLLTNTMGAQKDEIHTKYTTGLAESSWKVFKISMSAAFQSPKRTSFPSSRWATTCPVKGRNISY